MSNKAIDMTCPGCKEGMLSKSYSDKIISSFISNELDEKKVYVCNSCRKEFILLNGSICEVFAPFNT